MSFAQDRTSELWRGFRMARNAIPNTVSTHFFSVNARQRRRFTFRFGRTPDFPEKPHLEW